MNTKRWKRKLRLLTARWIQFWKRPKTSKRKLVTIGQAVIERDQKTNVRKWSCYHFGFNQETMFEPGISLVIPPKHFPEGTVVLFRVPEEASGKGAHW